MALAISCSSTTVRSCSPPLGGIFLSWSASCCACLRDACFCARSWIRSSLVRSRPILCSLSLASSAAPARLEWSTPGSAASSRWMKSALVRAMETPFCLARVWSCFTLRVFRSAICPPSKAALSFASSAALAFACSSMVWGGMMHAAGSAAALAPSSPPQIARGHATTLVQRQLGWAGCWGKRFVSNTLPSSGPQTGQTRSSSMVIHSSFRTPTWSWNLSRPWLWARRTSVRAITSMRYWALVNTLEPA